MAVCSGGGAALMSYEQPPATPANPIAVTNPTLRTGFFTIRMGISRYETPLRNDPQSMWKDTQREPLKSFSRCDCRLPVGPARSFSHVFFAFARWGNYL